MTATESENEKYDGAKCENASKTECGTAAVRRSQTFDELWVTHQSQAEDKCDISLFIREISIWTSLFSGLSGATIHTAFSDSLAFERRVWRTRKLDRQTV